MKKSFLKKISVLLLFILTVFSVSSVVQPTLNNNVISSILGSKSVYAASYGQGSAIYTFNIDSSYKSLLEDQGFSVPDSVTMEITTGNKIIMHQQITSAKSNMTTGGWGLDTNDTWYSFTSVTNGGFNYNNYTFVGYETYHNINGSTSYSRDELPTGLLWNMSFYYSVGSDKYSGSAYYTLQSKYVNTGGGGCDQSGSSSGYGQGSAIYTFNADPSFKSLLQDQGFSVPDVITMEITTGNRITMHGQITSANPSITTGGWILDNNDVWQSYTGSTNGGFKYNNYSFLEYETYDYMNGYRHYTRDEIPTGLLWNMPFYYSTGGSKHANSAYYTLQSKYVNTGGGGGNCGGGGTTVIVQGGGGSLIEIPRYDYNHTSSNTHTTIDQSTTGGKDLGKVTDDSKETVLKASLTNVPNNGIIYITEEGFQPQVLVQHKNDSGLVASGEEEENLVKKFFKDNNINMIVNTIDLNVVDIKDKTIDDFKSNYTSCPPTPAKGIECTTVTDSNGIKDMNNFKIKKPGRYLLTTYLTSGEEKYLLYKVIDARSSSEFTGLPIQNRLTAMVENKTLKEKNKNRSHEFDDLQFTFSSAKEDSMRIPSINNSVTNRIVIGSTDKGVKLFNNDLTTSTLSGDSLTDASITSVIELDGTTKVALSSDNKGAFLIDTSTGKTIKINSLLSDKVQSIAKLNNLFYLAFDDAIAVYYVDSTNTAHMRDNITSTEIFGSNVKLGAINLIGDKIMVNTHHESNNNHMAIVSKF